MAGGGGAVSITWCSMRPKIPELLQPTERMVRKFPRKSTGKSENSRDFQNANHLTKNVPSPLQG